MKRKNKTLNPQTENNQTLYGMKEDASNQTLGEFLRQTRINQNLSLEEIQEKVSIIPKHLKALESGNFYELPASVYIQAYLKSLSKLYGLETAKVLKMYDEEKTLMNLPPDASRLQPQPTLSQTFSLTPKTIATIFTLFVFTTAAIYLALQVRQVSSAPPLALQTPTDGEAIGTNYINVSGQTDSGSIVSINNQIVPVNPDGTFEQSIYVAEGENQIVVRSENRFKKSTTEKRRIVVAPTAPIEADKEILGASTKNTESKEDKIKPDKIEPEEAPIEAAETPEPLEN